jgi:hypothetical protein
VTDPEETWRDVIKKALRSSGSRIATNRFGQIASVMVDTGASISGTRHFRERIEIKRRAESRLVYSEIVNQYLYSYFWDPRAGNFRGVKIPISNPESIAAHVPGGVIGGTDLRGLKEEERELAYVSDPVTAYDVINRELVRRQRRPRYPAIVVPLLGIDHDLGERCRLTESGNGLGAAGDVATEVQILRHTTSLDQREVTLEFQDMRFNIETFIVGSTAGGTSSVVGSTALGTSRSVG